MTCSSETAPTDQPCRWELGIKPTLTFYLCSLPSPSDQLQNHELANGNKCQGGRSSSREAAFARREDANALGFQIHILDAERGGEVRDSSVLLVAAAAVVIVQRTCGHVIRVHADYHRHLHHEWA